LQEIRNKSCFEKFEGQKYPNLPAAIREKDAELKVYKRHLELSKSHSKL